MVVSRAERDVQAKFLLRNGADEVLYPEKQLAKWAAIRYGSDHVLDYIELDQDHAILEVSVPSAWIGKTVGDINIRKKYSINILGIKRNGIADVNIGTGRGKSPEPVLSYLIVCKGSGSFENGTADFAVSGCRTFSCFYRYPV